MSQPSFPENDGTCYNEHFGLCEGDGEANEHVDSQGEVTGYSKFCDPCYEHAAEPHGPYDCQWAHCESGGSFTMTGGEEKYYQQRNIPFPPRNCKACKAWADSATDLPLRCTACGVPMTWTRDQQIWAKKKSDEPFEPPKYCSRCRNLTEAQRRELAAVNRMYKTARRHAAGLFHTKDPLKGLQEFRGALTDRFGKVRSMRQAKQQLLATAVLAREFQRSGRYATARYSRETRLDGTRLPPMREQMGHEGMHADRAEKTAAGHNISPELASLIAKADLSPIQPPVQEIKDLYQNVRDPQGRTRLEHIARHDIALERAVEVAKSNDKSNILQFRDGRNNNIVRYDLRQNLVVVVKPNADPPMYPQPSMIVTAYEPDGFGYVAGKVAGFNTGSMWTINTN